MLPQGAASVSPMEAVGSSVNRLGNFQVKTKMRCATPVLGTVRCPEWA